MDSVHPTLSEYFEMSSCMGLELFANLVEENEVKRVGPWVMELMSLQEETPESLS